MDLTTKPITDADLVKLLVQRGSQIRSLVIRGFWAEEIVTTATVRVMSSYCPMLKFLFLKDCYLSNNVRVDSFPQTMHTITLDAGCMLGELFFQSSTIGLNMYECTNDRRKTKVAATTISSIANRSDGVSIIYSSSEVIHVFVGIQECKAFCGIWVGSEE